MNKLLKELISYIMEAGDKPKTPADQAKAAGYKSIGLGYWSKSGSPPAEASTRGGAFKVLSAAEKTAAQKDLGKQEPKSTTPTTPTRKPSSLPGVPQSTAIPMTTAPGKIPAKPIAPKEAAKDHDKLSALRNAIKSNTIKFDNDDHKDRAEAFMGLWQAFVSAPTYEEQVKAVEAMIEQNFVQGSPGGQKIYIHPNVGLPRKGMCTQPGGNPTSITKLMNQIVKDNNLDLQPEDGSKSSVMAAESGPANEAGVAALLDPTEQNNSTYEERKRRYAAAGGDVEEIDRLNRGAAEAVTGALPPGAKVVSAAQVGGVGSKKLQQLGIDPKTDPTDIILEYKVGGKTQTMKISAKIYTNPNRITMKNAGLEDAGNAYLGKSRGKVVDDLYANLRKKYSWTKPGMSEKDRVEAKRKFREEYLTKYSQEMEGLAKTKEGQQQLLDMWQKVHGCGKDVHTLVVNKKSGKSELKSPDHYCNPKLPFKVKYNGTKVVIEMDTKGPETLEINLKTEANGSVKLLFNHVVRSSKK